MAMPQQLHTAVLSAGAQLHNDWSTAVYQHSIHIRVEHRACFVFSHCWLGMAANGSASASRIPTFRCFVCCSTPYTPETHQVIDASAIAVMKSNAVLINVGQGRCIDEPALIAGEEASQTLIVHSSSCGVPAQQGSRAACALCTTCMHSFLPVLYSARGLMPSSHS
jgi:hypothetical protein